MLYKMGICSYGAFLVLIPDWRYKAASPEFEDTYCSYSRSHPFLLGTRSLCASVLPGNGIPGESFDMSTRFRYHQWRPHDGTSMDICWASPTYTVKFLGKWCHPSDTYGTIIHFLGSSFEWATYLWRFCNVPRDRGYMRSRLSIVGLIICLHGKYNLYIQLYVVRRHERRNDSLMRFWDKCEIPLLPVRTHAWWNAWSIRLGHP